ncbi:hypothetical protein [Mesorhizobium sp.]|uniref:hypothetical protein n=1 Tax=Mesorhizobium sp. TaxID=1871066 RepID=UPI000FE7673A|nr:hypothetical protein [Mesorhizobium sp.]RWI90612.1 MAG: hypothetical protein EOR22_24060 [Mesorhizobium sp.]TIQ10762.1 MAG: hypothetical protein E5X50_08110 [Mesorhizobium sp.]TIR20030.1 MAG: hypothetical protein E5X33_17740 [Mesorhizobium sp.]
MGDRPQFQLTEADEAALRSMGYLTINEHGEKTLIGLTVEESIEHHRSNIFSRNKSDTKRFRELNDKLVIAHRRALVNDTLRRLGVSPISDELAQRMDDATSRVVSAAAELSHAVQAAADLGIKFDIDVSEITVAGREQKQIKPKLVL